MQPQFPWLVVNFSLNGVAQLIQCLEIAKNLYELGTDYWSITDLRQLNLVSLSERTDVGEVPTRKSMLSSNVCVTAKKPIL